MGLNQQQSLCVCAVLQKPNIYLFDRHSLLIGTEQAGWLAFIHLQLLNLKGSTIEHVSGGYEQAADLLIRILVFGSNSIMAGGLLSTNSNSIVDCNWQHIIHAQNFMQVLFPSLQTCHLHWTLFPVLFPLTSILLKLGSAGITQKPFMRF